MILKEIEKVWLKRKIPLFLSFSEEKIADRGVPLLPPPLADASVKNASFFSFSLSLYVKQQGKMSK